MKTIHLGLTLPFDSPQVRDSSERFLMAILGHNCVINHRYLRHHPKTPKLYDSGITYAPPDQAADAKRISSGAMERVAKLLRKEGAEPHRIESVLQLLDGVEEFLDLPTLYKRGQGDCNELVPVRVAELWRAGVLASPYLTKQPGQGGGLVYHAVLRWPDGSLEDPSLILGMGGPGRAGDRQEEIRKNHDRWESHLAAAQKLIAEEGASPAVLGAEIDLLGLLPTDGVFRVGGRPVSVGQVPPFRRNPRRLPGVRHAA